MDTPKKQHNWKSFNFGENVAKPLQTLGKKCPRKIQSSENLKMKNFNFHEKIKPTQLGDLAVHSKKLQDVQRCLLDMLSKDDNNHPQFLLLSGPSGSGKLTCLKVICQEFGIAVHEWINPMDQDHEITHENQISQFLDFLVGSKWKSLFQKEQTQITIVKDFPNTLFRQPEQFQGILQECWYRTKMIIVFICSEIHNSNNYRKLFSDDIMREFEIQQIEFNSCASTLLKTAIKRAQILTKNHPELFTQLSTTLVDAIISTSMGDIRNAMNQFYLSSLKGGESISVENYTIKKENNGGKRKKRKSDGVKISFMQRDENLGLFHGLGRVLNPKWKDDCPYKTLNCDLEKIIDEFSTQPSTFISFLFENYLKYYGSFNDASKAAEILSFSALFMDSFGDRFEIVLYGLWISVLGLMVNNNHKVSKWTQIRKPVRINKKMVNDTHLFGYDTTDIFYFNLINSSRDEKKNLNERTIDYESDDFIIEDDD